MIHMATAMGLNLRFATIDTHRLHPETYAFMEEIKARYGCHFEVVQPKSGDVERMVARHGEYLFFDSKEKQEHCCQVRKEWPNNALLQTADCWISGQRWDQSAHRQQTAKKSGLDRRVQHPAQNTQAQSIGRLERRGANGVYAGKRLASASALLPRLPELWLHHLLHPDPARRTQAQRSLALVQRTS
jgi:3'-phosphoadenosine 5'-phosphosulfate sulfotransferase (PAPS reductase)/FAD synthetase